MKSKRDGVWTVNGLSADFRLLYQHQNKRDIYRVETASGEHYAKESELTWDHSPETNELLREMWHNASRQS